MAMILVGAYICLGAGSSSQKLIESRSEVVQSARVAMAIMSADLRCACPLSKDYQFLGLDRRLGNVEADNLDFATHNYAPRRVREGDFCQVSYFLEMNPSSGQFSLWRRRNPALAPEPLSGGSREEIVAGVRGLRFEYYDGYEWYDEWGEVDGHRQEPNSWLDQGNLFGMPEAVRITLWFDPNPRLISEASPRKTATEPPLMFQTVVRLNLAASLRHSSASGLSTNSVSGGVSKSQEGARN
jgi:type II secretory pathway component PulJ